MRDPKITFDTVRLAALLGAGKCASPAQMIEAVRDVAELERISRSINRLDAMAYNGVPDPAKYDPRRKPEDQICKWDENDRAAYDAKVARLKARANSTAKLYGLTVRHQGDPRGCSLYLVWPDGSERGV